MKLGVNVDHVATLRQARGTIYPDPLDAAIYCGRAGAYGITAHLREDRRHIQDEDIFRLKSLQPLPLNLEMANVPEMVSIALDVLPEEVCLVPEKRAELTTEGGLNVVAQFDQLTDTVAQLQQANIAVSLFIDPSREMIEASEETGAKVIELHTGAYADASDEEKPEHLESLIEAASYAHKLGLTVNAGHGITMDNINGILCIPHLYCLNIGHSIISRALFLGMEGAVKEMLEAIEDYEA